MAIIELLCSVILICIILQLMKICRCPMLLTWRWTTFDTDKSVSGITEKITGKQGHARPFTMPPLRERTACPTRMALRRLDEGNWLVIDSEYLPQHKIRNQLLEHSRPKVIQCLPGSLEACREVLELVTGFLCWRYPECFTLTSAPVPRLHNLLAQESYELGSQCSDPLEVAARLAMEDFNILIKNPLTDEYHLQASATLFPAGWELQERIGTTLANLHHPVPDWTTKVGHHVTHYFDNLSTKTHMERYNLFIQTTPNLFQDSLSFQQTPTLEVKDIMVRRERQTFKRLPKSGAVLFTVKTYMQPLLSLEVEDVRGLRSQIRSWDGEMGEYKGVSSWGKLALDWCDEVLGERGCIEG